MMRGISALLFAALLVGSLPTPALAQSAAQEARAKELFENGKILYEEGQYDEAVVAWKAAYDLSPQPLLLFNMANAYERLGRYTEALDALNRYRALAPAEERDTLERRIRNIEDRLAELRERAATGSTSDPLMDATGSQMTITTSGSKSRGGGGGGEARPPHPAGVILIGVGAGGLAAGAVLGTLARQERAEAEALCVASGDDLLCPAEAKEYIDRDRNLSLGGDIAFIAGGAALGAGVIILVVDAVTGGDGGSAHLQLQPSFGPDGGAVTLTGRF